jgi:hypothetical protein
MDSFSILVLMSSMYPLSLTELVSLIAGDYRGDLNGCQVYERFS